MTNVRCIECKNADGKYTILDGMSVKRVCDECYDTIFYRYSRKGIQVFSAWAMQNYMDREVAQRIAVEIFGDEAVEFFKFDNVFLPMFTYGILKYPRNIEQEGGRNIVENSTVYGHVMYATGGRGFPVTRKTGNPRDVIYGTYFEVPAETVYNSYDLTEGYSPYYEKSNCMYVREIVKVGLSTTGELVDANMYIANESWFIRDMVEPYRITTGNYDDKYTKQVHMVNSQKLD